MSIIKINVIIKNNNDKINFNTTAILRENKIEYIEDNNTITKFDFEKKQLIRTNDIIKMVYYFDKNKETEGLITLKESNTTVTINITTNKIQRKDHDIKIEYSIENEVFLYQIKEIKWV